MKELAPITENRPWGEFREFIKNEPVTVKIIKVKAGETLSLQKHSKRSEFWRVLSGSPEITIGEKVFIAKEGEEFNIRQGDNHRIGSGEGDSEILEISTGFFDEEDIIRLEDKYGRA
jgi:mannose-6-phosphate isomerase-like protein (cupin superfamily)